MKREVKVSAVQFAPEWLQREKNIQRMVKFAEAEAAGGAELIVFPEVSNIGFITPVLPGSPIEFEGMSYAQFTTAFARAAEAVPGPTTEALAEVARKHGVYIVVGIAQKHPSVVATLYNSAVLIGPGGIIGVHHKMHIGLMERLYFYAGNTAQVFKTKLGNLAMSICYDNRFPELSRVLTLKGAEIIINIWAVPSGPSSFIPDFDAIKYRTFMRAHENGVYYISCSRVGKEGSVQYIGRSCIAAPPGQIIAASDNAEEGVIRAELKEDILISYRTAHNPFIARRPELYGLICKPVSEPYTPHPLVPEDESTDGPIEV